MYQVPIVIDGARLEAGDDGEGEGGGPRPVDNAVVEGDADVGDGRMTISPSRTTARCEMRWTPRMPTSGALISGVTRKPASLPALVTVKVEPCRSARSSVPARARSASASTSARSSSSALRVAAADDGNDEALLRLHRHAEVVRSR